MSKNDTLTQRLKLKKNGSSRTEEHSDWAEKKNQESIQTIKNKKEAVGSKIAYLKISNQKEKRKID